MDLELDDHVRLDSLKRKRETAAKTTIPDLEHNETHEKRSKIAGSYTSLDNMTTRTTDIDRESSDAVGLRTRFPSTITNSDTTSIDTDTFSAAHVVEVEDHLSKPTLQTLPRELRDLIYDYVAATEERIILGRRMVDYERENDKWDLNGCFDEAVALHPLSMTCRQFRDEFQKEHMSASELPWVLLVNNFDLEQLEIFSRYIQHDLDTTISYGLAPDDLDDFPKYEPDITLRFQLDDGTARSASKLCQHVYFDGDVKGAAPASLADYNGEGKLLSTAEIVTHVQTPERQNCRHARLR